MYEYSKPINKIECVDQVRSFLNAFMRAEIHIKYL